MKRISSVLFVIFFLFLSNVFADDVTLTTYYPAPFGMYEEMRVMGKLGVGTTDPASKVDIDTGSNLSGLRLRGEGENAEIGDIYMGSEGQMIFSTKNGTDSSRYIDLRPEDNAYGVIIRESDGTSTTPYANLYVVDAVDDYFSINVNSVTDGDALVVAASNNIGIGTTSPKARLHVREEGTVGVDEIARFGSYNSDLPSVIIGSESSAPGLGYLSLYRAEVSLPKVRITASDTVSTYFNSGNVGIGTTNPSASLQVAGDIKQGSDFVLDDSNRSGISVYINDKGCDGSVGTSALTTMQSNATSCPGAAATCTGTGNCSQLYESDCLNMDDCHWVPHNGGECTGGVYNCSSQSVPPQSNCLSMCTYTPIGSLSNTFLGVLID